MKLNVVDRLNVDLGFDDWWAAGTGIPEDLAREIAKLGLASWSANVVLAPDGMVADLNLRYRGREGVTDVLSFSYAVGSGMGPPDLAAGEGGAASDLWLEKPETVVGEIILAPEFVFGRCQSRGWPLAEEFNLLVVHGCLHLLGWDHEDPGEQMKMRGLETEILAAMGLPHPLAGKSEKRS